ncbi:MAG: glycosyltransferase [Vulcanimicrobiota bacterium]
MAYLSGAPSVSLRENCPQYGARTHILGVLAGFEELAWETRRYIAGDFLPNRGNPQEYLQKSRAARLASDFVRLALWPVNALCSYFMLGEADVFYERSGSFQAIGCLLKGLGRRGCLVVEVNGIHHLESRDEYRTLELVDLAHRIQRTSLAAADLVICVSEQLKALVADTFDIPDQKILVVPNGVNASRLQVGSEASRFFAGPTICFVGQVQRWQNLCALLEAMDRLRQDGIAYGLVVAGGGVGLRECQQLSVKLGLAEQVKFLGPVPPSQVGAILAGCDLGFSGQRDLAWGGMYHSPLKLYEYLAAGLPVIVSDFRDARALVARAECGFVFEAHTAGSLENALREACAGQERWSEMGRRGQQLVESEHSWRSRVQQVLDALEERGLLGPRRGHA